MSRSARLFFPFPVAALLLATFFLWLGARGVPLALAHSDHGPLFGLATGLGDIEDDSYNDMLYNGMVLARATYGIRYLVETPRREQDDIPIMESLINRGCKAIIAGGGYHMIKPVEVLAKKYPDVTFVLMDDVAISYPPNVASVTFRQNEGSFLAGALAALSSKEKRIAFLGAEDLPIINDFFVGYEAGAKHVAPEVVLDVAYVAQGVQIDLNPYDAPKRSEELARELYDAGSEVIFAVAAGSNKGVFAAAKERQRFAIGVDSDQDHLAKGYVLTSMLKRLDSATMLMVRKILDGELQNRNYSLGLKEGGVGLTHMTYTRMLIPEHVLRTIMSLRGEIEAGLIAVPTTMPQAQQQ